MAGKRVFKYPLEIADDLTVDLPHGAEVLTVQVQHGEPCLWARVDPEAPLAPRRFRWAGTGHPLDAASDWPYVGSVQLESGMLVFHLFRED